MRGAFSIIDTNRHVMEPADLWNAVTDEARRPVVQVAAGNTGVSVLGQAVSLPPVDFLGNEHYRRLFGDAVAAGFSAESNLRDMDREGIDGAVLWPTAGMYAVWANHLSAATSAALCRDYNDWLARYCKTDSARLRGLALLPLQSVPDAVQELRRAVDQDGLAGCILRPNPLLNRYLHDPVYDPLYRAAEELGVPVVVQESLGSTLPTVGSERYGSDRLFELKAVAEPFEIMLAFLSFFGHNVVERFPELQVGFVGAGAGWLPFWLERHEEHWGGIPFGYDCPSTLPADWLFERQGFVALAPWETTAPDIAEIVSADCLVWGSGYPLPDLTDFPHEVDRVVNDARLSDEHKRQVLHANAAKLFRF